MTDVASKIASFKERQSQILALSAEFEEASGALADDCQGRIDAIKTEFEVKKAELASELEKAKEAYKADVKAAFGVTDGEPLNIVQMVEFIHRVASSA